MRTHFIVSDTRRPSKPVEVACVSYVSCFIPLLFFPCCSVSTSLSLPLLFRAKMSFLESCMWPFQQQALKISTILIIQWISLQILKTRMKNAYSSSATRHRDGMKQLNHIALILAGVSLNRQLKICSLSMIRLVKVRFATLLKF